MSDSPNGWNRGRPANYAYVDRTLTEWMTRAFGGAAWFRIGPGFDRHIYCPVCDDPLAVIEETRNPAHEIDHLWRVARRMRVPGLVVLLDGDAPKSLHLVQWGESDDGTWRRYMDDVSNSPGRQPDSFVLSTGPAAVTLRLGQITLEHLVRNHPDSPLVDEAARQLSVDIAELPDA